MTRAECKYCRRNVYADGKCYADSRTGKPIETYSECDWAKKVSNNKQKPKED